MVDARNDSERIYATLVETAPVGVFQTDLSGNTIFANNAMRRLVGLYGADISVETWLSHLHPDDRGWLAEYWQQILRDGVGGMASYRIVGPAGQLFWVQAQAAPILDRDGQATGFVGTIADITAERELRAKTERLSRLYATLSQVNSAIIHCTGEQQLYDAICSIMVEKGGFTGAIVSRVDWARRKSILASSSDVWQDEVRRHNTELDLDDPEFQTLTIMTLLSGAPETANDIQNEERLSQRYREVTRSIDVRAGSAVAFTRFGETIAGLALSSSELNFFSDDILALIDEVGRDVSFALENFAREEQRKQTEAALVRNEERLRLSLRVTNIGLYEVDLATSNMRYDEVCARLTGVGEVAGELTVAEFIRQARIPVDAVVSLDLINSLGRDTVSVFIRDYSLMLPDGTLRWLRSQSGVSGELDAEDRPVCMLGVLSDITESKVQEERSRLAAAVFNHSGEAILIADADRKIMMANQAFSRITGYEPKEILGTTVDLLKSSRHDDAFYEDIAKTVRRDGAWQGEIWRSRKSGETFPALVAIPAVKDKHGRITHFVLHERDISMQKEFEARISHLAYRDALTDLPNRTLLRDRVDQSIAIAHRESRSLALLFLDLDHFKNINDSLGHVVGDHLLKEVAQRLTGAIREMDTVGRLGGDEFLLVLPDADADAAAHVAQKLLEACARPFAFENHSLTVTPSVGIALYPKDGTSFDELLKTADTAMYRAKDEGRNAYRFYTPEMNQAVFQRMMLESSLRRAIEQNEFVLHYQPKFELQGQTLIGVEALIRWHQPEMGIISPAQFIPVAEESGLIEAIGEWVLEEACRQVKAWRDEGLPPLRVAVNFSARQFAARNVAELVTATLKKTGVSGDVLEMEITESLLAQDMDYTLKVLRSLKKLGVHVAVDDFGTGYSNLSYLKRFPIDRLKIDQSFVRDLVTDADDRAIATAIVTLGHSLDIRVIAEGVETVKQMELLRDMGCDEVQGYYLGRPIPADEMTIALRKFATRSSRGA